MMLIVYFYIRKWILGFKNANFMLSRVDKNAIIPLLRLNGASIGNNCDIETGLVFHNCENYSNLKVGNNCHIGKNCFFDLRDKIIIEDNVVISMQCTIITHIDMNKSEMCKIFPAKQAQVYICKNCYLGAKTTVLMNLTLNENSFVAAGSVVAKDVPPFTMVGGVPVRFIKKIKNE